MERIDAQAVFDQLVRRHIQAHSSYWPRHLTPDQRQVLPTDALLGVPDGSQFTEAEPRDWRYPVRQHPEVRPVQPHDGHAAPRFPLAPRRQFSECETASRWSGLTQDRLRQRWSMVCLPAGSGLTKSS